MGTVYEKALLREEALQSKYVSQLEEFEPVDSVKEQVENDLLDVIVFCKWILERMGRY